ncbi:MAG: O-antigen ligase family protein [Acetobacteraceae bacterium]
MTGAPRLRLDPIALAGLAGAAAAALHFAGALKSAPVLARLPADITVLAALAAAPLLLLLAATRRWTLAPALALPLAAAAALWLWLVVAALWSPSRIVAADKLRDVLLLAPPLLLAGLLVGADAAARRMLAGATLLAGVVVAASVVLGLAAGEVQLGGEARAGVVRVQYQLVGLLLASAAALAAVFALEARGVRRVFRLGLAGLLAAAALLPGGRAGLIGLAAALLAAPAAWLWAAGRRGAALGLGLLGGGAAAGALALLLADPALAEGFRTLERLLDNGLDASARPALWGAALALAGEAMPWGLGTGGFTVAAGFGEWRGLYPHNHAIEALAEGGLPGLLLWLLAFGGGAVVLASRLTRLGPGRAARLIALTLPMAVAALVSTDLGNRMVWFALGLALSAALTSEERLG